MVDPTTANTSMTVPIRGTNVGIWDTPVNGNFTSLDAMMGGVTSVALTSAPVTLTTSQALVNIIRFTGTLNANVAVTLPGIYKSWTVDNLLTNSPSSFAVSLVSSGGTSIIGLPPGSQDVFYDGTSVKYRNLGKIGEYWDYAASTVPSWVTVSTNKPYLNCDGTVISSATYPVLVNLLGTTTLPDARGRTRAVLNQTTSRLTSSVAVDGDTIFSGGGTQATAISSIHLPSTALNEPSSGHKHTLQTSSGATNLVGAFTGSFGGGSGGISFGSSLSINPALTGITFGTSTPTSFAQVQPTYIGGITMIRTGL